MIVKLADVDVRHLFLFTVGLGTLGELQYCARKLSFVL